MHIFAFALIAQTPSPSPVATPAPPQPWMQEWRDATVALGEIKEAEVTNPKGTVEKKKVFLPVGTGVIMFAGAPPRQIPVLVTAKHVFNDTTKNWNPISLQVRFSWFEARPVDEYLGVKIQLETPKARVWIEHPDSAVDLACIPVNFSLSELGRKGVAIDVESFAAQSDYFEGSSIAILGYPGAVGAPYWTRPVLRYGIIAWVAPSDASKRPFMVDSNVFPGNSGGPVFRVPSGLDRFGTFALGGRVTFLGIVTSGAVQYIPSVAGGKTITIPGVQSETVLSASFMGLGIVEPVSRVRELLDHAARTLSR